MPRAMKSTSKTTVRKVSEDTVRVSGASTRSAVTGKYITSTGVNRFATAKSMAKASSR